MKTKNDDAICAVIYATLWLTAFLLLGGAR